MSRWTGTRRAHTDVLVFASLLLHTRGVSADGHSTFDTRCVLTCCLVQARYVEQLLTDYGFDVDVKSRDTGRTAAMTGYDHVSSAP